MQIKQDGGSEQHLCMLTEGRSRGNSAPSESSRLSHTSCLFEGLLYTESYSHRFQDFIFLPHCESLHICLRGIRLDVVLVSADGTFGLFAQFVCVFTFHRSPSPLGIRPHGKLFTFWVVSVELLPAGPQKRLCNSGPGVSGTLTLKKEALMRTLMVLMVLMVLRGPSVLSVLVWTIFGLHVCCFSARLHRTVNWYTDYLELNISVF